MILNALVEQVKRRSKDDIKGSGTPHTCQSILECEVMLGTPSRRA
jgi:hypothetical protein